MAGQSDKSSSSNPFGGGRIGIALLVIAFVVSLYISVRNSFRIERPTRTTIRIAHWQLERGYREALDEVIQEYKKLHPDVDIIQMPVTEKLYGQWLNTQLISGQGPDLCEMGNSNLASQEQYTVRYFLPLSTYITDPNPYNAGTDLADVPWRETLLDGMKGGFREGLQEYYGVPTTLNSMRLFYNKQLLSAATGSDQPPASFGDWMRQCKAIRKYAAGHDPRIIPIVSVYDIIGTIQVRYEPSFTAGYESTLDLDLDGSISGTETYIGFCNNNVSPGDPHMRALYETMRSVGDQMQQDFFAMDRQQSQFRFVYGQAGFMWTGSWDAAGTVSQAKQRGFDVGIVELPLPREGDPNAQYVIGRANEATASGSGTYGVSRSSKHTDIAIDFLKFFTGRRGNGLFAQKAGWPALTIGVPRSPLMAAFTPNARGYNSRVNLFIGARVSQTAYGSLLNYYQGETGFGTVGDQLRTAISDPARGGQWAVEYDVNQRMKDVRTKERILAQQSGIGLLDPASADHARYRRTLLQQVTRNDGADLRYLYESQTGKKLAN